MHYLDITGELVVLEGLHRLSDQATKAGIVLMPATGFDVVPTDCMAMHLAERCPDGDRLLLAFGNFGSRISHGTLSSLLTRLGEAGAERINGQIQPRPVGRLLERIDWGKRSSWCISIPWGGFVHGRDQHGHTPYRYDDDGFTAFTSYAEIPIYF